MMTIVLDIMIRDVEQCLIIGSGFGGLCQAIKLKKANIQNFTILEKESSLGGTWRDNTYPGAACDVPSSLYSYSFDIAQTTWTSDYTEQKGILQYIHKVAKKYDIQKHIIYQQNVCRMEYREEEFVWYVFTDDGSLYKAKCVVTAVGQLHHPKIPVFPGVKAFKGGMVHTSKFGSRQLEDYADKNVAVIGSGASAVQLIPELQKVCRNVYVFQRTPNYILPRLDLTPKLQKVMNTFTFTKWLYRLYLLNVGEVFLLGAIKGKRWAQKLLMALWFQNMKQHIQDESLQEELNPTFSIGANRILFSDTFYPALGKSNVHIISKGIKEIDTNGIVSLNESRTEVDDIVYATGFITNPFLYDMIVTGRSGKVLWEGDQGSHGYFGVNTHGFPNLFFLYGPNTNVGHTSILLFVEEQADFVIRTMSHLDDNGFQAIEVKKQIEDAFGSEINKRSEHLAFTSVKDSWYLSSNGCNTNNWVGSFKEYKCRLKRVDLAVDFDMHGKKPLRRNSKKMPSQAEKHWILSLCFRFLQSVISIIFSAPKAIITKREKFD